MENNRPLLIILIIIGILILISLMSRGQMMSYRGYGLTASATPVSVRTGSRLPDREYYTFFRYVPVQRTYVTYPSSSYSYSASETYYPSSSTYYPTDGGTVFPDGCTLTSPYSTTTGLPCS